MRRVNREHSKKTKAVLPSTRWVDKIALARETTRYQKALAKNPDKARLSDAWGLMAMDVAHNTLSHRRFRHAAPEVKDEMRSAAYEALVRSAARWDPSMNGLDGTDEERGASCLSYFMATAYWACFSTMNKVIDSDHDRVDYIVSELKERGVSDAMIDYLIYGVRGGTSERLSEDVLDGPE